MGASKKAAGRLVRVSIGIASMIGGLLTARAAHAEVCGELDTARDNLSEAERRATKPLLDHALEKTQQRVVSAPCPATYRVYHIKLGASVTVILIDPTGDSRQLKIRSIEEIPEAYDQMVKALITRTPVGIEGAGMDRTNVTTTQSLPPGRVTADSLFYLRLGAGSVLGGSFSAGPDFGLGWRRELDRLAIDLSILNLTLAPVNDEYKNVSGSWVKVMALYYFDPYASNTLYAGAGLSWGGTHIYKDSRDYSQSGLAGEIALGYEMLRVSNIRMLLQLDISLPFYAVKAAETSNYDSATRSYLTTPGATLYAPTIGLSLGVGFGKANTLVVQTVQ